MNPFAPGIGDTVGIRDTTRRCIITNFYPGSLVGVRDCGTRAESEKLHIRLIVPPPPPKENAAPSAEVAKGMAHPDLSRISEEDWEKAKLRYAIIKPFLDVSRPPASAVEQRAKEHGYARSRLYAWMQAYRNGGQSLSTLLDGKPSVRKGARLLDPRIEEVLSKTIEAHYMTNQKRRITKIDVLLEARCKEEGIPTDSNPDAPDFCKPHINTIRNRINALSPRRRMELREGRDKASKYMVRGEGFVADFPMQYVQIDHTLVNVILRDEKTGCILGRPWITVAIDTYSRMVVGYYISFEVPGGIGTGLCVSHLILPKDEWLLEHAEAFGEKPPDWPCYGLPDTLHMDNAREFRGNMLKRACEQYGISIVFRPVKTPHYGAHIESYMDKLSEEFRTLPGATFSNPVERGKHYDSEAESAIGFRTFSLWLANHICCVYHYRPHGGLEGMSPIEKWEQAMYEGTGTLAPRGKTQARYLGDDATRLELDFIPYEERTVSSAGVAINRIQYMSGTLRKWIGAKDPDHPRRSRNFTFRVDPRNIDTIYFWNPELEQYERIQYRDLRRPSCTLWELKAARKTLLAERRIPYAKQTEPMIFEALRRNREFVEAAVTQKKKIRAAGKLRPGIHARRLKLKAPPKAIADESRTDAENIPPDLTAFDDLDFG